MQFPLDLNLKHNNRVPSASPKPYYIRSQINISYNFYFLNKMKKELIQGVVSASPQSQNLSSFPKQAAKEHSYTARSLFFSFVSLHNFLKLSKVSKIWVENTPNLISL